MKYTCWHTYPSYIALFLNKCKMTYLVGKMNVCSFAQKCLQPLQCSPWFSLAVGQFDLNSVRPRSVCLILVQN